MPFQFFTIFILSLTYPIVETYTPHKLNPFNKAPLYKETPHFHQSTPLQRDFIPSTITTIACLYLFVYKLSKIEIEQKFIETLKSKAPVNWKFNVEFQSIILGSFLSLLFLFKLLFGETISDSGFNKRKKKLRLNSKIIILYFTFLF